MYPKVFTDYATRHQTYGPVRALPTPVFFYGMEPSDEIEATIEPGVTLNIRLQAVSETHEDGEVRVFFELNGQPPRHPRPRPPRHRCRRQAPPRPRPATMRISARRCRAWWPASRCRPAPA